MSCDFFGAGSSVQDATNGVSGFADALLARYGQSGIQNVQGHEIFANPPPAADRTPSNPPRALPPVLALPRMPTTLPMRTPVASTPPAIGPPVPPAMFQSTSPEGLQALLADSACLVVDLRPHAQYANARLPHAISLSVPSTLLKRPAFPLSKLADMLPAGVRARLSQWPTATRVLVYDGDGAPPSQNTNVGGFLNKFVAEGCPPLKLTWLKGGFQNVWRHHRELVDADPPSDDDDEASGNEADEPTRGALQSRQLPLAAFTSSSTTASKQASSTPRFEAPRSAPHVAFNPFFDAIRQNVELSQGITERIPLRFPQSVLDRVDDLPFRWLRDIVRHSGVDGAPAGTKEQEDEVSEILAMQFYRIELAEQRRLTGIMQHHSKQDSGVRLANSEKAVPFPYSITAGVEKGAKNRYRNIWPFEHARVRLQQLRSTDDDYINASYVQPLGTNKRYIATQGPLPATFGDFWALVWEQNVHVVVMLTREVEGAMVKCGKYWADGTYGALRLRQLSTSGGTPNTDSDSRKPDTGAAGFFVPSAPISTKRTGPATIRRTFELTHTGFPGARPRTITQLHYVDWPDMNVPDSPTGLLELIHEANQAQAEAEMNLDAERLRAASARDWKGEDDDQACTITGVARHALGHQPVLLHCSAGVGRTGGYIAVDAVLNGIRRELTADGTSDYEDADMAVDSSESSGEREPHTTTMEAGAPMDVDVPSRSSAAVTGPPGQRREAHGTAEGSSPVGSFPKSRRPSGSAGWARNDPRRMPLRKWSVATNEAAAHEVPAAAPMNALDGGSPISSPSPTRSPDTSSSSPPSVTPSPVPPIATQSSSSPGPAFPQVDALHKALPPQSAARLHPDSHRVRATSAPSVASGIRARRLLAHPRDTSRLGGPHQSTSSFGTSSNAEQSLFSAVGGSATSMTSPPPASLNQRSTSSLCPPAGPTETFDYTAPRKLHTDVAACALSTLSEPIRAIVEDAREQRMSLCQSLRQYVFVHQAVVEGALALVDELRAAPPRARTASGASMASGSTSEIVTTTGIKPGMLRPSLSPNKAKRRRSTMDADALREAGATLSKRPSIKRERLAGDPLA